jgi:hypothetical protein
MTVSSSRTVKVPPVRDGVVPAVETVPAVESVETVPAMESMQLRVVPQAPRAPELPRGRLERKAERFQARRERRAWAIVGLGFLALVFGAAVAVLDVLH